MTQRSPPSRQVRCASAMPNAAPVRSFSATAWLRTRSRSSLSPAQTGAMGGVRRGAVRDAEPRDELELPDVHPVGFSAVLQFIYTGKCTIADEETSARLREAAEWLGREINTRD